MPPKLDSIQLIPYSTSLIAVCLRDIAAEEAHRTLQDDREVLTGFAIDEVWPFSSLTI